MVFKLAQPSFITWVILFQRPIIHMGVFTAEDSTKYPKPQFFLTIREALQIRAGMSSKRKILLGMWATQAKQKSALELTQKSSLPIQRSTASQSHNPIRLQMKSLEIMRSYPSRTLHQSQIFSHGKTVHLSDLKNQWGLLVCPVKSAKIQRETHSELVLENILRGAHQLLR